ncbi:NAD kinase 1 [Paenibacillus sp. J31TS4]|uniref:NAD kinase n=1 Tax=Paenibacillus sp. J31TS4 TaxID=2807195 RepID=UPI001B06577F|nr:NAD kinase [Paenibacillus sp. J31TS4]GIP40801.1 NAD kinase 1 [Paenibacillus sp. J31TS4]
MKYFVVDRGDEISLKLTEQFHQLAASYGMILSDESPDYVVSIGGDGTMLHAFHRFINRLNDIAFVGIHTGRLGFYADWTPDEIEELARVMNSPAEADHLRIVRYPLVEIAITTKNGETETHVALNEFTLRGIEETLVAQLNINDVTFEMFRGDGICISTPSGSTAYNKALNGGLIHPSIEAIQIAEIASINNRVFRTLGSSMILPKHHHCDIYPHAKRRFLLSIDHLHAQRSDVVSIRCRVSDRKVHFARFRPYPFWSRVQRAFIGDDFNK